MSVAAARGNAHPRVRVQHGDAARNSLISGSALMARALAPTLDSRGGATLVATDDQVGFERLSSGGTLARRLVAIGGTFEALGASIVREAACRVDDEFGDGAALTAVLTHALVVEYTRLAAGGADAHLLAAEIESAVARVVEEILRRWSQEAADPLVARLAERSVRDGVVAGLVADAVRSSGTDGWVEIVETVGAPQLDYLTGARWDLGTIRGPGRISADWGTTRVVVVDDPIHEVAEVLPLVERSCHQVGRLALVGARIPEEVSRLFAAQSGRNGLPELVAVRLPVDGVFDDSLEDIAAYVGADVVSSVSGAGLADVQDRHFGQVAGLVLSDRSLRLTGPLTPERVIARANLLRRRAITLPEQADQLRMRAARLDGIVVELGVLQAFAGSDAVATTRQAVRVATAAVAGGVVESAATTLYLAARSEAVAGAGDGSDSCFAAALSAPLRRILQRQDTDPARWSLTLDPSSSPASHGADDVQPTCLVIASVRAAGSAAAAMLRTQVLVHNPTPRGRVAP